MKKQSQLQTAILKLDSQTAIKNLGSSVPYLIMEIKAKSEGTVLLTDFNFRDKDRDRIITMISINIKIKTSKPKQYVICSKWDA